MRIPRESHMTYALPIEMKKMIFSMVLYVFIFLTPSTLSARTCHRSSGLPFPQRCVSNEALTLACKDILVAATLACTYGRAIA